MASNRHLGRIIVLQTLYELTFRKECNDNDANVDDILDRNISRYTATLDDKNFIQSLAKGVMSEASQLDEKLQPIAPDWPLAQIARIDYIVLHIGAYELIHHTDVPPKVVINEAVELAKGFGGDSSSRFVNGVLGTLLRQLHPEIALELDATHQKEVEDEKTK